MLQMPNEVDDDDTESMSEDEPDAAPAAAGRRRVAPEQVVTDAFHYALAIGGKSITVSSMMSFDIEDENFEPTYVSRVDPGEVDAEQFSGTPPFAKIIVRSTDHQFRSDLARVIAL